MKNFIFLLSLGIIFTTIFSCNKDNNLEQEKEEMYTQYTKALHEFNYDVEVSDDLLSFETSEAFENALTKLSSTENGYYTSQAIANWQERIGFKSMGVKYQNAMNEFKEVDSDAAYDQFISNHPDIKMSDDVEVDGIELPVADIYLAYLLNEEGKVMIGDYLHMFTDKHQIIVLDGEESKLQLALETLESNTDLGIYVLSYILNENTTSDISSGNVAIVRSCGTNHDAQEQDGNKKVVSEIRLYAAAYPISWIAGWNYSVRVQFTSKSEKKNWRGKWKSYDVELWLHYEYEAIATINSSTTNHSYVQPFYFQNTSDHVLSHTLIYGDLPNTSLSNAPTVSGSFIKWNHNVNNLTDNIDLNWRCGF